MLFWKECKKTICSLMFVLYAAAVIFMYISQFAPELNAPLTKPQPGETYDSVKKEVPEVLMPAATESLIREYLAGIYTAYPFLFYKAVKLKESDSMKIAEIIEELTGITGQELNDFTEYQISENVSYERFKELMKQADEIIGGGSKYSEQYLIANFSLIPMSYEDALEEYETVTDEKNIAESYSRLYCDYMGIALSIIPVFVCGGLWQMDKKSRMEQLVYSRRISSAKLMLIRYLAMVICMLIPVLLTFIHAMIGVYGLYPEKDIYFGKAAGLALIWLLPEIMIVSGIGALISELFSPFLAVFVQGIWWYAALGKNELTGSITKYTLIIRHNTLGQPVLFESQFNNFIENRIGYMLLSLLSAGLLIFVYDKVRRGGFYHGIKFEAENVWKNNKRKFSA